MSSNSVLLPQVVLQPLTWTRHHFVPTADQKRYTQNAAFQLNKTTSPLISDWFLKPTAGHSAGIIPHNATADSATIQQSTPKRPASDAQAINESYQLASNQNLEQPCSHQLMSDNPYQAIQQDIQAEQGANPIGSDLRWNRNHPPEQIIDVASGSSSSTSASDSPMGFTADDTHLGMGSSIPVIGLRPSDQRVSDLIQRLR
ncbi:protein HUA ENHANCER 2 [Dorcoceras hygrometricum]|uniref:Protein HUA ENHANCER 2 n=1 Tax=Dorcoceras hygrometricum TaxID=472368 RepID=A0A2Z7A6S1_9LAMI|nr:protein HUA ENHANCER 2 [Dorcoceras hygrometricum]